MNTEHPLTQVLKDVSPSPTQALLYYLLCSCSHVALSVFGIAGVPYPAAASNHTSFPLNCNKQFVMVVIFKSYLQYLT